MNNLNKISLAALILCSISSTSVFAQDTDANAPVVVDPAVIRAMDYNPSWYIQANANLIRPDSEFGVGEHGAGFGFNLGKPLSEDWDIQIGTRFADQRLNGMNYQQNMLGVDGLYMLSRSTFRPFILMGAGYQEDRLSNAPTGEVQGYAPYVEAGVGVQAVLSDQWSLQLDFRREHGFLRNNDFGSNGNNNNYLSLGISYAFDKSPTLAVAQAAPTPPPAPIVVMAPPPPPPAPAPAPRFEKIVLSSTELFGFDQSALHMPQPKLDEIARVLNNNTQVNNIVIDGYTDRIGSDKYNQKLSERRANAVKDYLVGKGVSADRLTAEGKGKSNPLVTCTDKKLSKLIECLEPNRRVEVEQIVVEQRVDGK